MLCCFSMLIIQQTQVTMSLLGNLFNKILQAYIFAVGSTFNIHNWFKPFIQAEILFQQSSAYPNLTEYTFRLSLIQIHLSSPLKYYLFQLVLSRTTSNSDKFSFFPCEHFSSLLEISITNFIFPHSQITQNTFLTHRNIVQSSKPFF